MFSWVAARHKITTPALAVLLGLRRQGHLLAMTKKGTTPPKADDRAARLAAALRENLRRRKAQARARDAAADEPATPAKVAGEKPMG
ncbi:hypothetical protein GCM10011320_21440 [Neoroseomonas lacus]|uniref:Uncharacterized protein n=1 Tax=Neoroseomonas lacus TaxID=287609 RepID=A0A917KHK1_9PROT|nr:hypothetical protein GCM10011320_21440 [Neoroseomonas lacus]